MSKSVKARSGYRIKGNKIQNTNIEIRKKFKLLKL